MAITITPHILGQVVSSTCSYCYLYEPLRIAITESDVSAENLFIDLEIVDTADINNVIETNLEYAVYDLVNGKTISVDLMKIAEQYHDANLLKFGKIDDIKDAWDAVVSKYRYRFIIRSNTSVTDVVVFKLPILGVRDFNDFIQDPGIFQYTDEYRREGLNITDRVRYHQSITTSLEEASSVDSRPVIILNDPLDFVQGVQPCPAYLIWKSRLGAWMSWEFDIMTESHKHQHTGNLESGMLESTLQNNGNPYIPVDYTRVDYNYTINLKSLSLSQKELRAVNGINSAQVVYMVRGLVENLTNPPSILEAMRLTSATVPLSNQSNGGDFSVSLKSISQTYQKVR